MRQTPLVALLVALALPATAQAATHKSYVLHHPRREHCLRGYWKQRERRKVHGKRVEQMWCVYRAPKPAAKAPVPTPGVTPAGHVPAYRLHARLDPSFTQNPDNPTIVTYTYSASASVEGVGLAEDAPSLPEGVLSLYSDGLLACSMDVGGAITGGECTVASSIGAQTVVVTYQSGSTSATETYSEVIGSVATTTTDEATSSPGSGGATVWEVAAHVLPVGGSSPVFGAISYTFTDATTGATEASVTVQAAQNCLIYVRADEGATTYADGEGGKTGSRCPFGGFSVAETDSITVTAAFAGTREYQPSGGAAVEI